MIDSDHSKLQRVVRSRFSFVPNEPAVCCRCNGVQIFNSLNTQVPAEEIKAALVRKRQGMSTSIKPKQESSADQVFATQLHQPVMIMDGTAGSVDTLTSQRKEPCWPLAALLRLTSMPMTAMMAIPIFCRSLKQCLSSKGPQENRRCNQPVLSVVFSVVLFLCGGGIRHVLCSAR